MGKAQRTVRIHARASPLFFLAFAFAAPPSLPSLPPSDRSIRMAIIVSRERVVVRSQVRIDRLPTWDLEDGDGSRAFRDLTKVAGDCHCP